MCCRCGVELKFDKIAIAETLRILNVGLTMAWLTYT